MTLTYGLVGLLKRTQQPLLVRLWQAAIPQRVQPGQFTRRGFFSARQGGDAPRDAIRQVGGSWGGIVVSHMDSTLVRIAAAASASSSINLRVLGLHCDRPRHSVLSCMLS